MHKKEFRDLVESRLVILDGATGTELAQRGQPAGVCPERWILENPAVLTELQAAYAAAGSHIVYAPTFGGNRYKLAQFGEEKNVRALNRELAALSRAAAGKAHVFGNLAPMGRFIEPFGDLPFDEAVAAYAEQIGGLIEGGVDGFVVETMIDIQEARAALLAVRESCDLPIMVSMTFERTGRTLNGTDPVSAVITLQSLGADAVGCNCSTGPADMLELVRLVKPWATVPLMAKPNAGMPHLEGGRTVFDMGPAEFAGFVDDFVGAGVNIFGGCCGTTPEHIALTARAGARLVGAPPLRRGLSALSSARGHHVMGHDRPFTIIGERINPTGKKALQAELREGKLSLVREYAADQQARGAQVLDVNMGMPGIDESAMLAAAINTLVRITELPLCIDTTRPDAMEAALRRYPGRALVNSISGETERLAKTLPIAAKYGAMIIVLPLTDEGIPAGLAGRQAVVERVMAEALRLGCRREDLLVDALAMAVSADQGAAGTCLELIEWATREQGLLTVCGLSNISFGLPERHWINNAFLAMAVDRGLTAAIANPAAESLTGLAAATDALTGRDQRFQRFLARFTPAPGLLTGSEPVTETPSGDAVFRCVLTGDDEAIVNKVDQALAAGASPQDIVDRSLIPAIQLVGERFDRKEYYLPQLIMSADTMRRAFTHLEPQLSTGGGSHGTTVILATVKGDIHDIGKNIVALMLRNYGFRVVDLGKDIETEAIIENARRESAVLIGLSALMTTTMVEMESVTALVRRELPGRKVIVGGAVVDQGYADAIGADGYAGDAMAAVRLAQRLTGTGPA